LGWLLKVEDYATIYYSEDNFKGMARTFGKSVAEAGLAQLIAHLNYKCRTGGKNLVAVNSGVHHHDLLDLWSQKRSC
jgi:hypothetical protein